MQIDPIQTQQNIEEFKKRRNRQLMVSVPFVLLLLASFWLGENRGTAPLGVSPDMFAAIFVASVIGILIFSFRNWRCPACNGYLGKGISPRFCPKCGAQLQ